MFGNIVSKFKMNSPEQQMLKQKVLPPSPPLSLLSLLLK